ncbi:MAG: hypothetical protein J5750_04250 [Clostridiales bacterium]|nr:hypothetical protein [Clostridiales bacterium]
MGGIFDDVVREQENPWGVWACNQVSRFVYLSYPQDLYTDAVRVVQALDKAEYRIWFDEESQAMVWRGEMSDAVERCAIMIYLRPFEGRKRVVNMCEEAFAEGLRKKRLHVYIKVPEEEKALPEKERKIPSESDSVVYVDTKDPKLPEILKERLTKLGIPPTWEWSVREVKRPMFDLMLSFYPDIQDKLEEGSGSGEKLVCNLRTHIGYDEKRNKHFTMSERELHVAQELKLDQYFIVGKHGAPDYEQTDDDYKLLMHLVHGFYAVSDEELEAFRKDRKDENIGENGDG